MPTVEQAMILEAMWRNGKSMSLISKATGMTLAATREYIVNHEDDCPRRSQSAFTESERTFIVNSWNNGATCEQIANALNVTTSSVTNFDTKNRDNCHNKNKLRKQPTGEEDEQAEI